MPIPTTLIATFYPGPVDPRGNNSQTRGLTNFEASSHVPGQLPLIKLYVSGDKDKGLKPAILEAPYISFKQASDAFDTWVNDENRDMVKGVDFTKIQEMNLDGYKKTGSRYVKTFIVFSPHS
jgi:hypothetical protein